MKHFVNILDHDAEALDRLLVRAAGLKTRFRRGERGGLLDGRVFAAFFEKPSTRTRFGFEAAAATLGAYVITREMVGEARLGQREPVKDVARVTGRYCDLVAVRTFAHETVEAFAAHAGRPVVNLLSDYSHPTQAMADMLTIREHLGAERDKTLVFIGDGNNVARSLAAACGRLGMRMTLACPEGYGFDAAFRERLERECPAFAFEEVRDPAAAAGNADILYTDVWASMGQEAEATARADAFREYQINADLLAKAPAGCRIMHDLPAHRGEEITDEAIESEASIVFDQAENRMHLYRGLFPLLLDA